MLSELTLIKTNSTDPYHNLAMEEYLLRTVRSGQCILYLWQNRQTVVIGRNQNAEDECRIQLLESDGGHLARRLSGGGAVYHDMGNLNFTFLVAAEDYDLERQTEVVLSAVRTVGINAVKTGRNDLTADGRKFSGHAFYHTCGRSYHHGTLMVQVDSGSMERYLNVSPLKLRATGVPSLRSRVVNLAELAPGLSVRQLGSALESAFGAVYGLPVTVIGEESLDADVVAVGRKKFASPEWLYGKMRPMTYSKSARFPWGTVRVDYSLADGIICDAALWSDGLEVDYLSEVPKILRGCTRSAKSLLQCLRANANGELARIAADIAGLLIEKEN